MRVLGLRAEPDAFNWAISEGTLEAPVVVAVDRVAGPRGYSDPEVLNHFRARLLHIAKQHSPVAVGLRTPEPVARGGGDSAKCRLRVEGVLLAVSGELGLQVTLGALVTINSLLGSKSAKLFLNSDEFRGINWSHYTPAKREAILISASLLPREAHADNSRAQI
jgi:hypothetical protein